MSEQKEKMVQIEHSLFMACVKLIALELPNEELWKDTANRLEEKLRKMVNRNLYTIYKTAETEEEREAARLKYLDSVGIPRSFRW